MVKTNPSSVRRVVVYGLAGLQFFFQVTPAFAGVFQADEQSVAQTAVEAGRVLQGSNSGDAARQLLTSQASGQAADAVTQWLNQFGTAKTQLSVDSDFSLKGSSLDVLLPFYNTPKNVLFTQLGMRDNDGRFTTNAGLGHRYFTDNGWMLGYNVFYDVDWRNTNRRYGTGVEAWRDYLKLSANGYKRLSDWRQSPTVTDYDERPADGWDIRAEGWLPAYPQLGGKLVYEQYYGNEVALFGESERQKNPHAITAGVTWTPFPLLTTGVDYRRGKNGADDTRLNLGLTYRIGEPLAHQLDSSRVGAQRSLAANRLELVNRNNDMVLEYRKQTLITLQLPPDVYGAELTTVTLTPQVNAKYGLSRIELDDAELRQAGNAQVSLSLNGTTTTVSAPRVSFTQQLYLTLQAGRTTAVADGNDVITYTLNVRDVAGQPVKDKAVQWSTDLGTLSPLQGTTSAQGEATVTLTSTQAGQAVVNATVDGKQISAQSVTFTRTVRGVITVEKERVYPGSKQTVTLTLTDAAGNPVSGERVDWHADSGNLWQTQGTTDAQGRTTTTWESTTPGTATITADAYGQQYTAPVITVMPALTVSSVTGIDATGADGKNFGRRVPASTWPGAKFRIDTENAAGTVTWTASSPAVSINGNIMTVKSNPAGVTLTGTDADGQTVTLNMGSNWFAQSATKWEWLNGDYDGTAIYSCRQLGAQVASSGALQGVISEWGELETYEGWTNLKNDWLYSSTTVISGNGVKSTIAYLFPGGKEGLLTGIRGYYACR
ncbi:inverse autotransporter beta-barrel domain-containing protein [Escherichia coli]|uniref:inverse autotransporter beta domain-containing protein n=1 Tax=Escherichia coli TaxID=562 RepID=UPI000428976A|nr:inverse autotransporter beta-barrel domain-containing protein [Escherichia coli]MBB9579880.1 inverse autotransporter beta-barrel domain-containing protein [Escherichia coli]